GSAKGFVALSYVWGQNQTYVLTAATQGKLHSSFSIHDLPQTIQDAITVTRAIGLRFIWVDALCILQDSPTDKATELPKMRLIYERATITLVASVAPSATEGFLHHKPSPSYSISPIHIQNPHDPASALILSYPAPYDRRADPINLRAWTFQELLLSRRAVLFSYRGLDFIDRTSIPAADGDTSGRDPQLPNLPWSGPLFRLRDIEPENLRSVWLTVRGEYSRRNLSYAGDKLLAVSTVAEEIGRGYRSKYLAGLWEKDLESELKWSRADASYVGRPKEYVAPSWSWASIKSPVDDFHADGEGTPLEDKLGFGIVKCEVELTVPGFEYGAVVSGSLHVRGRVHSFFWRP
ncbi:HET-domain-containing protein, partial [Bimuria novae-zelandiae CBS 107.79]